MSALDELRLSGVEESVLTALVEGAERVQATFPSMIENGDEAQWVPIAFFADGEGVSVHGMSGPDDLPELVRESGMNVSVVGFVAEAWIAVVDKDSSDELDQKLLDGTVPAREAPDRLDAVMVTLVSKAKFLEFYREIVRKDGEPPELAEGAWTVTEDDPSPRSWLSALRDALV